MSSRIGRAVVDAVQNLAPFAITGSPTAPTSERRQNGLIAETLPGPRTASYRL
jgi:hypothetical protein